MVLLAEKTTSGGFCSEKPWVSASVTVWGGPHSVPRKMTLWASLAVLPFMMA